MGELVGEKVYDRFGIEFPLLIKFIDAQDDLSIQVHPGDKLAKERHNSYGKTEMWYIMDTKPDASLISGFNKQVRKMNTLITYRTKNSKKIMNFVPVKQAIHSYSSGKGHAIGTGILLAENTADIDITYRIYDWERVDSNGNPRELHTISRWML
jgi:mannose-6-phosphate isomerase